MTTSVAVDVVLATNRVSPFLDEALDHVLRQSHPHWNLIVVDDHCPDPVALIHKVRRVPGAVVIPNDGSGVSSARNAGVRHGASELIAFHDDDDIWHEDKLALQVAAMSGDLEAVACHTGGWYMDAIGRPFGDGWPGFDASSARLLSGDVPLPRIVSLMVRRSAFVMAGQFDPTYVLAEDLDLVVRLAELGEFVSVDEPLVGYRRHDHNTSQAGSLAGRIASRRLIIARLHASQDPRHQVYLRQYLRRQKQIWAAEVVRNGARALRDRDVRTLSRELRWGLRFVPLRSARVAFEKLRAKATGR